MPESFVELSDMVIASVLEPSKLDELLNRQIQVHLILNKIKKVTAFDPNAHDYCLSIYKPVREDLLHDVKLKKSSVWCEPQHSYSPKCWY